MIKNTLILIILTTTSFASEFIFELYIYKPKLNGSINYKIPSNELWVVKSNSKLNIVETKTIVSPSIIYISKSKKHKVKLNYENTFFKTNNNLIVNVEDTDHNINIKSSTNMDWYKFAYDYKIYQNNNLNWYMGTNINIINTETDISYSSLFYSNVAKYEELLIIPTISTSLNYQINKNNSISLYLSGIKLDKNSFIESSINYKYLYPEIEGLSLDIGYGYKSINYYKNNEFFKDLNFNWNNYYLGLSYKF